MCAEFDVSLTWIDTVYGSLGACIVVRSMSPECAPADRRKGEKKKIKKREEKSERWKEENKAQMIDLCCHRRIHCLMAALVHTHRYDSWIYINVGSVSRNDVTCAWQRTATSNQLPHILLSRHSDTRKKIKWNRMDIESQARSSLKNHKVAKCLYVRLSSITLRVLEFSSNQKRMNQSHRMRHARDAQTSSSTTSASAAAAATPASQDDRKFVQLKYAAHRTHRATTAMLATQK